MITGGQISMPNGKQSDHPLTDILVHKRPTFSPAIDTLITEIATLGGERELEARFNLFQPPPLGVFEAELRIMRDHLKKDAKERGWEVT